MKNLIGEIPPQNLRVQGLKETLREVKAGNVARIILASDCDENFIKKIHNLNLPLQMVSSKVALGNKLQLDVPCGVVAILKSEKL
ncbi:MAG: ribosomal L7Ae/L30e/S12e/Gadd45 family protein [Bacillota bacterium]